MKITLQTSFPIEALQVQFLVSNVVVLVRSMDPETEEEYFYEHREEAVVWSAELPPSNFVELPPLPPSVRSVRFFVKMEGCIVASVTVGAEDASVHVPVLREEAA